MFELGLQSSLDITRNTGLIKNTSTLPGSDIELYQNIRSWYQIPGPCVGLPDLLNELQYASKKDTVFYISILMNWLSTSTLTKLVPDLCRLLFLEV